MAPQKVLMFLSFHLPGVDWLIISFFVLVEAVVLVPGGRFTGGVSFAALWVVDAGCVARADEATKRKKTIKLNWSYEMYSTNNVHGLL